MRGYLMLLCCTLLLLGSVSALLPVKDINDAPERITDDGAKRYPQIEINNLLGLGENIATFTLERHTEYCTTSCFSEFTIDLKEDAPLVDDIAFYDAGSRKQQSIRSYAIKKQDGFDSITVDDYARQCTSRGTYANGSAILSCAEVRTGSHVEQVPRYVSYTLGDVAAAGVHTIRLEGSKRAEQSIDWVITSQGKVLDEWSNWTYQNPLTDIANASMGSSGADNAYRGYQIKPNQDVRLLNVTIHQNDTSTNCNLTNNSNFVLANSTVLFKNATFFYNLTQGTLYRVVCGGVGSTMAFNTATFRTINRTNINFTNAIYDGAIDNSGQRTVLSVTTQVLANASTITLVAPADATTNLTNSYVNFTCTASVLGANLSNISLYHNASGTWQLNSTQTFSGRNNATVGFNQLMPNPQNVLWTCRACDSDTVCTFAGQNRTVSFTEFIVNSRTFNATTYETSQEGFTVNVSYSSTQYSSASATLFYKNVPYSTTGSGTGNTEFTRSIIIPLTNSTINNTFWWTIYLTNSTATYAYNTTNSTQTVNPTTFIACNATYATKAVNYSIYNESTTNTSIVNVSFKGTFTWGSTASSTKTYKFSGLGSSFTFCIDPNVTFTTSADIELSANGYRTRVYNLNRQSYNSTVTAQPLYMLGSDQGTAVIVKLSDVGLSPLSNYVFDIYRIFPDAGTLLISEHKTDIYGKFVEYMIENSVKYRFNIKDANNTLIKSTDDVIIACEATPCILSLILEDDTDYFERFDNVTNAEVGLSFDNNTNIFSFSWNDNSGESATYRWTVQRYTFNGTSTVCSNSSTSAISSFSCNVGAGEANYIVQVYRSVGGVERRIALLQETVGTEFTKFGKEGLFWAFILLMTLVAVGSWNPPVGIGLYLVGFLLLTSIHVIYASPAVFIAMLAIGVAFIWAFRS